MEKQFIPYILILSFLFVGCSDPVEPTSTTKTVDVPGQLLVRFGSRVAITDAYQLMDDLSLQAIDFSDLEDETEPNWGTVGVPEGEETYWLKQLGHYPIVISVQRKTREVPL